MLGTYEVRDPEAEKKLREIGNKLADNMPPGYGFTLMIYQFGEQGNMFYFSNAQRDDMINVMREFIQKHAEN